MESSLYIYESTKHRIHLGAKVEVTYPPCEHIILVWAEPKSWNVEHLWQRISAAYTVTTE